MTLRPLALALALGLPASSFAAGSGSGLDLRNFNRQVSACQDFYEYANGNWLRKNPVPAAFSTWGSFNELEQRNNERLQALAEAAAAKTDAAPGSAEALVGAFYAAAMDEAAIERLGLDPLRPDLERIDAIGDRAALVAELTRSHAEGRGFLFGFGSRQDLKDNTRVIAYAVQGGLGLPNRDYYLKDDAESRRLRGQYRDFIAQLLTLAGTEASRAEVEAEAIIALETRLAQGWLTREELRDPNKSYNLVTVAAADAATPNFSWSRFLAALDLSERVQEFSLSHPNFFAVMDHELAHTALGTWRAYLRFHALRGAAPFLSKTYADAHFAFYNTTLRGQKEQRPRPIRVIEQMNGMLGEPLGQLFVARYFPPEAKARMMVMIGNLKTALRERLEQLPWMGEETRQKALEKWRSFTPKIGYPERWRDYSGLELRRDGYFANVLAVGRFAEAYDRSKIGRPVDKSEWGMPPQQVNAYYNPLWNEIVFPAGILQPPFFDMQADDALNYGGIGAVIGHELLHGFDDQGSRFDAEGRLNMWWTEADRNEFNARTERLVRQAEEFKVLGDLRLNGRVSLGENIADLGGLQIAYNALQAALGDQPRTKIDGFTPEQRFFLSWAQVWRRNFTDEALRIQINVGPHAPSKFRTNGPLANLPEFHAAFGCKPGDPMVRPEELRVAIW